MSEWQPIESAPRDGTMIQIAWLAFNHGPVEYGPFVTWWENDKWHGHWTPTHWRLLPEPPNG